MRNNTKAVAKKLAGGLRCLALIGFLITGLIAVSSCSNRRAEQPDRKNSYVIEVIESAPEVDGMAFIKGGTYRFIRHDQSLDVSVQSFYIDKYPVTIADFAQFVRESGYLPISDIPDSTSFFLQKTNRPDTAFFPVLDSFFISKGKEITWRHDEFGNLRDSSDWHYPVIHISFNDAVAYAAWAGKRLPTMYEWQYVAIKGLETKPASVFLIQNAWYNGTTRGIMPAGLNEPNDFGVYDLIGNIGEYVDRGGHVFEIPGLPPYERLGVYAASGFTMESEELFPPAFALTLNWLSSYEIGFRCAMDIPIQK
jgi:formylglycine-generating enzyme